VALQVELSFEGLVDRLDDLAQRLGEPGTRPFGLAFARRVQQTQLGFGEGGLEVAAEVVLVPDDDLPGPAFEQVPAGQDVQQRLTLVGFGAGQGEAGGQPLQGSQQVQPQPPEVARM
jgi:hypothetical protein